MKTAEQIGSVKFVDKWRDSPSTLEALEQDYWGAPTFPSHVVTRSHAIRQTPLRELTAEDLRLAIGQQMGLPFLLPLAFELLRANPLEAGEMFDGALFASVIRIRHEFWKEHPNLWRETKLIGEDFWRQTSGDKGMRRDYDGFLAAG